MKRSALFSALLVSCSAAAVLAPADAQSLPSRTIGLTCTRSVTPATSLGLKTRLLAEPFSCTFNYRVIRSGRTVAAGELIVPLPAKNASITVVKTVVGAQSFDSVEVLDSYHSTALPIDKAWVGGRCQPIQNKYPKQTVTVTRSPFVGVYLHQASLEERFDCR